MYQIEQDLTYVQSTVHDLEEYLLSGVLFWPITVKGGKHLPAGSTQLTLGNLLLCMKRLEAAGALSTRSLNEAAGLADEVNRVRRQWKSNWDKKAEAEILSRLTQWDHYLAELAHSRGGKQGDFPYNIRLRAILGLLMGDIDELLPKDLAYLDALDQRLRSSTHPGEFVWDETLRGGFPEQTYWYLYRKPA